MAEIAKAESLDVTQVRRILRLTLLAPEVIERLVDAPDMALEQVMRRPWPTGWAEQNGTFTGAGGPLRVHAPVSQRRAKSSAASGRPK